MNRIFFLGKWDGWTYWIYDDYYLCSNRCLACWKEPQQRRIALGLEWKCIVLIFSKISSMIRVVGVISYDSMNSNAHVTSKNVRCPASTKYHPIEFCSSLSIVIFKHNAHAINDFESKQWNTTRAITTTKNKGGVNSVDLTHSRQCTWLFSGELTTMILSINRYAICPYLINFQDSGTRMHTHESNIGHLPLQQTQCQIT